MMTYFYSALEKLRMYNGHGWHLILFLLALGYLCVCRREKEHRKFWVSYTVVFAVIFFCPLTAKIIMDYCIGESVYWRMMWLLPIPLVIAYVCARLAGKQKKPPLQIACFALLAALIIAGGKNMYFGEGGRLEKADNINKIPAEVTLICETILQDGDPQEVKKAVIPDWLTGFIRQYTPQIEMAFGRWGGEGKASKRIYKQMTSGDPDFEVVAENARKLLCAYLVYWVTQEQDELLQEMGYVPIGQVNGYIIYRDTAG